jgi:hypothetical protein
MVVDAQVCQILFTRIGCISIYVGDLPSLLGQISIEPIAQSATPRALKQHSDLNTASDLLPWHVVLQGRLTIEYH